MLKIVCYRLRESSSTIRLAFYTSHFIVSASPFPIDLVFLLLLLLLLDAEHGPELNLHHLGRGRLGRRRGSRGRQGRHPRG